MAINTVLEAAYWNLYPQSTAFPNNHLEQIGSTSWPALLQRKTKQQAEKPDHTAHFEGAVDAIGSLESARHIMRMFHT